MKLQNEDKKIENQHKIDLTKTEGEIKANEMKINN